MKVKEIWNFLCNDLEIKLFTGTPLIEFKQLFNSMDADIMHYIPSVNEEVAVGLVTGAYLAGVRGAVFMSSIYFDKL